MKKMIIMVLMMICLSSIAFAAVTRSGSGNNVVTYTSALTSTYTKAYWAVEDPVIGCTISGVSCTGTNVDCNYVGGAIRVVSYTPDGGGTLASSVQLTITGTDVCTIGPGSFVESTDIEVKTAETLVGTLSATLGGGGCSIYGDTYPDCNGIDRTELGLVAQEWINAGGPSGTLRDNLGLAAQDWMNRGGPDTI